jgi:hypothetical protein
LDDPQARRRRPHGSGAWTSNDDLVYVRTDDGGKCTQIGGSPPEVIARLMLWELANEGKP